MTSSQPSTVVIANLSVFTLVLFLLDMTVAAIEPLAAPYVGYVVIVVLAGRLLPRHYIVLFSGCCTLGVILGLQLSFWPQEGATSLVVMNRLMVILILWIITVLTFQQQTTERTLPAMPAPPTRRMPQQGELVPQAPAILSHANGADTNQLTNRDTRAMVFAHEASNVLHSMSLAAQMLEQAVHEQVNTLGEEGQLSVSSLVKSVQRLTLLLDEFRSDTRTAPVTLYPIALPRLVEDVLQREKRYYHQRGVTIEDEVPHDLPMVLGDEAKMEQLLRNLCQNAAEAMPHGGTIRIRARQMNRYVCLEVSDTGVGVPPGVDIEALFVTTKPQGTGLGLPIAHQIVAAHHGSLTYTSAPGDGTTFYVTLPTTPHAAQNGSRL